VGLVMVQGTCSVDINRLMCIAEYQQLQYVVWADRPVQLDFDFIRSVVSVLCFIVIVLKLSG
jgi:hypothetical protein